MKLVKIPEGHKKNIVHLVFDMDHDGRHKARLVASRNLTDMLLSSIYSSIVSLKGIQLVLFLAELNSLDSQRICIGNTYLEVKTKEKSALSQKKNLIILKNILYLSKGTLKT